MKTYLTLAIFLALGLTSLAQPYGMGIDLQDLTGTSTEGETIEQYFSQNADLSADPRKASLQIFSQTGATLSKIGSPTKGSLIKGELGDVIMIETAAAKMSLSKKDHLGWQVEVLSDGRIKATPPNSNPLRAESIKNTDSFVLGGDGEEAFIEGSDGKPVPIKGAEVKDGKIIIPKNKEGNVGGHTIKTGESDVRISFSQDPHLKLLETQAQLNRALRISKGAWTEEVRTLYNKREAEKLDLGLNQISSQSILQKIPLSQTNSVIFSESSILASGSGFTLTPKSGNILMLPEKNEINTNGGAAVEVGKSLLVSEVGPKGIKMYLAKVKNGEQSNVEVTVTAYEKPETSYKLNGRGSSSSSTNGVVNSRSTNGFPGLANPELVGHNIDRAIELKKTYGKKIYPDEFTHVASIGVAENAGKLGAKLDKDVKCGSCGFGQVSKWAVADVNNNLGIKAYESDPQVLTPEENVQVTALYSSQMRSLVEQKCGAKCTPDAAREISMLYYNTGPTAMGNAFSSYLAQTSNPSANGLVQHLKSRPGLLPPNQQFKVNGLYDGYLKRYRQAYSNLKSP